MTRFAGIILAVAALVPAAALAETVAVRSGDHPGFTRLVVGLGAEDDWVIGRVDGGFELRPGRADVDYRLSRVYDKIGRNRIEVIRDLGDGRLQLGVSCDCHAVVDVLADGQVVLDIATGPARSPGTGPNAALPPFGDARVEPVADDNRSVDPSAWVARPVVVSDRAGLPLMVPGLGPRVSGANSGADKGARPTSASPAAMADAGQAQPTPAGDGSVDTMGAALDPAAETSTDDAQAARTARIATTEAALLEQVARAAAQGLLEADIDEVETDRPPEDQTEPAPPPVEPPAPPATESGHMSVETSIDRAATGPKRQRHETGTGDACLDPALFDVASWGDGTASKADIGAYRARLLTELDTADAAGVTALVRNYIYITFGAEAKALIRRYPESVERADLLFAMAEIMDDGQSTRAPDLVEQMSCTGATALWAMLAQPALRPGAAFDRAAVAMAFGALPAHLRRHLGPRLADRLLASGDRETADIVRAAIERAIDRTGERANEPPASYYGLLTAQFELGEGEIDQATTTLDGVVAAGDAALPEALLQRVEATLGAGGAVPEDVIVLLDGMAFQFRGTDTAREMVDAGIRARISAGAFDAAFDQLDAAATAGLLPPERDAELRDALFARLVQDTDDTAFLRLSLPRVAQIAGLTAAPRRTLAERLLDLGLPDAAREALGSTAAMPEAGDRLLLARAALVENRPAVAIGYLAGLVDDTALALRASALDMARDHAGALHAYEATGDRAKMARMAWRGGLWPEAAALDSGPIGTAAQLMAGEPALAPSADVSAGAGDPGVAPGEQPALTRAQALIDESAAARAALDALLGDVMPPTGTPVPDAVPGL